MHDYDQIISPMARNRDHIIDSDFRAVEQRTQQIGRVLLGGMQRYRPSLAESAGDRAMLLLATDARFRAHLLRFVDALSGLSGDRRGERLRRLLQEYLAGDFPQLPPFPRALVPILRSSIWPAPLVAEAARLITSGIAARFIASGGPEGALTVLFFLSTRGRLPSFDVLGEYVVSEQEADAYRDQYLGLLRVLGKAPAAGLRTRGSVQALQISLKLSSLTSDFNPVDPEGTLASVRPRLVQIVGLARRLGIGVTLDMERYETRDLVQRIFFEVFRRGEPFGDWDGIGVVVQAYLCDAEAQVGELLAFVADRGTPFQVRLVKGAYWDYETIRARANGWPVPVWEEKANTDVTFERLTERLLAAHEIRLAVASHNVRSHAHAEAVRERLSLPSGAVEHQTLFRTAEGVTRALAWMGWPVRDYVPLGDLLPGMSYLVRRILENSSQVGFLLQSRTGESAKELLAPPTPGSRSVDARPGSLGPGQEPPVAGPFHNEPPARLFVERQRQAFIAALESTRPEFGRHYFPRLGGEDVRTEDITPIRDPSHPEAPPIGYVHNAGKAEVARALELAGAAMAGWAGRSIAERAAILRRAADLLKSGQDIAAAWIVHEAAKSWMEATADVDEAIDYLRYYSLRAEDLSDRWAEYRPRGVVAVIPPWNFPIAIPCGMTAAALVTGNVAVLKPAEQTPLIARLLVGVLHDAGVPEDALIWLPGPGDVTGAALVSSPAVDMVAFTGSRSVGTAIYREGSRIEPLRGGLRTSLTEMGGKNPILIFADADLDEAVVDVLTSAFGHANQKCSAASRILVQNPIYERFVQRLVQGVHSLPTGPADDPGVVITPLIDEEARERVASAAERARKEGRILLDELHREDSPVTVGPLLVEILPSQAGRARTAQEEIFGPILTVIPFESEQDGQRVANGTSYALTAGIFSRSPETIARTASALDAGNVYVNRPITGARVGVEPFGGRRLSGTGPQAGGPEYLWAFVSRSAGFRKDGVLPEGTTCIAPNSLRPWATSAEHRAAILQNALARLDIEQADDQSWPGSPSPTYQKSTDSELALRLLERIGEITDPEPTVPLPGQDTETRWDTPRGCGVVIIDQGATTSYLLALIVGTLLAGNGITIWPNRERRRLVERLLHNWYEAGVPATAATLAPAELDLAATIALPAITFAAVDAGVDAGRKVYRMLAGSSATPDCPHLKALISVTDGPSPEQPGFLRRFALPKTIAVRTRHLGAELDLGSFEHRPGRSAGSGGR